MSDFSFTTGQANYRKPDGIFRLTKIMNLHEAQIARYSQPMREQIEQLIEELEAKAQNHEREATKLGIRGEATREYSKATATYYCIKRLWELLADSQPVSGEIDTKDRV